MTENTVTAEQPKLVEAMVRLDFYSFVRAAFPIVSTEKAFEPNWHIEAMAFALTQVFEGKTKRLIITVPPRHLKSICASVAFPAFALGHDPRRRIVCVSYADGLARKHANDCRALMHSELYQRLFPATRISASKDTEQEFMTTAGGTRFTTSVGGTLTGRGGSIIIIDDPMKPQDAQSELARENTKQWYSNTLLGRLDDKSKDAIVVVMQRLHVDDLVGHLLEKGGWEHLNLPAIAESEHAVPLSEQRRHLRKLGDLLHPEREPAHVLDELKRSMGSLDFGAQYLQAPVVEGGNLVKWEWFEFYDDPPSYKPGDRIIVSWDTALSAKDLASYSVGIVLQARGETVFVLDVVRERLEYPELKRRVIDLHRRWRNVGSNYALLIENKGSGMSLIQDLKREQIHAIGVEVDGDKVMRMNAQTARMEAGSVSLPRQAHWLDEFRREILAFPSSRHTDQVDAFSQGLDRAFNWRRGESAVGHAIGLLY